MPCVIRGCVPDVDGSTQVQLASKSAFCSAVMRLNEPFLERDARKMWMISDMGNGGTSLRNVAWKDYYHQSASKRVAMWGSIWGLEGGFVKVWAVPSGSIRFSYRVLAVVQHTVLSQPGLSENHDPR